MKATLARVAYPVGTLIFLVVLWHFYVVLFDVSRIVLPKPWAVWTEVVENFDVLLRHGWVTMIEALLGFLVAVAIGMPIATALTYSPFLQKTIYPLLIASQSIPKIALAPIIVLWLGFGLEAKLAISFLVAFFPVVIGTSTGLNATPTEMLDLTRSLKASGLQTLAKVRLPFAAPFVFAGFKIAITLAVIGAVIGEFVASTEGLGNLLLVATSQSNTALSFAALIALSVIGILLYAGVVLFQRIVAPWSEPAAGTGI